MSEQSLFIPLKRPYFEAFEARSKEYEYRRYGARWNERTCAVGKRVCLSLGYGRHRRLVGRILGFSVCDSKDCPEWLECYGEAEAQVAAIHIHIDGVLEFR